MNTVYSLFQNVVAENSNKTAIIEKNRTMTFGELSRENNQCWNCNEPSCGNDCRNTGGTKMWCKSCFLYGGLVRKQQMLF